MDADSLLSGMADANTTIANMLSTGQGLKTNNANTDAQTPKHPHKWSTYHFLARRWLREACEACGASERLIVHHIDQDFKNDAESNAQTLCETCHNFWHSAAKRNGREIAGRMPALYKVGCIT